MTGITDYDETPLYIRNDSSQNFQSIDAPHILKDITFVRLNLENICMNEEDEFINEVIRKRSLFGFILDYQFPSIDAASTSLKARVRVHAKHFNGSVLHFHHKRVVRIKMIPELVTLWKRTPLLLTVYAKLNTLGKYSMKKLGSCQVPLEELVVPPFIICRDFLFVGPGFSASALIKIDLGSHIRILMERLEWIRNGSLPGLGAATLARSRSSSRKGSNNRCSRLTSPLPQRLLKPFPTPLPPLNLASDSPSSTLLPSPHAVNIPHPMTIRELCPTSPSYRIKLTVYSARRLPLSFNSRGEATAPSTYLTVIGEDGRTLSSPVRAGTLQPEWNWTETFNVSRSRQNLVVKLWKRCISGSDKVIGFISLQLPPTDTRKCEYEMSDLSVSDQAPLITLSISYETHLDGESCNDAALTTSLSPSIPIRPLLSETSPRLQKMTSEEILEKLR
uniref:C2 domain-containing protein n=1 Tax=Setaria digitata TaxID=48799 RepID=A0A915PX36_9BILA